MQTVILIFTGVLGVIVGSFLNVVILRYNTGKGIGGRSMCMACRKTLSWYELLPLVSFVIQNGRCRSCGARLSMQYFIVELLTGVSFVLVASRYVSNILVSSEQSLALLFGFVLVSLFMIIAVYDLRHLIMPDAFVASFVGLSVIQLFVPILSGGTTWFALPTLLQVLAGVVVPLPFLILWLISKGRWIGFGDIKFMVGIGLLLGLAQGITAVIFSFWIGTIWILGLYVFRVIMQLLSTRRFEDLGLHRIIGREIPFAPFLILATFIIFVSRFDLLAFLTHF